MNELQTDIKPVIHDIKEGLLKWLPKEVAYIFYLPDTFKDSDSKCYYFLIILNRDPEKFTIEFWSEFYKNVESVWDNFWINQSSSENIPILSVNFRSLEYIADPLSISFLTEESPELLYENQNIGIVGQKRVLDPEYGECDMIWI